MFDELTATPGTALQVAIATLVSYAALVLLLRLGGQRMVATLSLPDLAFLMVVGAVVGRTALLAEPSLVTGLVALVTLAATHTIVIVLVGRTGLGGWLRPRPVVLLRDGRLLPDAMRRARINADQVRQHLRLEGVAALEEVALVVLESNGQLSVLRGPVAPELLADLPPAGPQEPPDRIL